MIHDVAIWLTKDGWLQGIAGMIAGAILCLAIQITISKRNRNLR